jgi:hypothetical protein
MKIFFGAAIQGASDIEERIPIYRTIIDSLKSSGHEVVTEHTTGNTREERAKLLDSAIGPLPPKGIERTVYIRDRMISEIEGAIDAAVFEVSVPSLGTGIEIAHAYLRGERNLKPIPILALYQKDYWPNKLSSMIRGITPKTVSCLTLKEYATPDEAMACLNSFITSLK